MSAANTAQSRQIQELINTLSTERTGQLDSINQLFTNFGVSAKQDIAEQTQKARGKASQNLIRRGLSQTTIRGGRLGEIARGGQREARRVDESVARAQAGFQERQLVDPGLILGLIQQASSVNTTPQNVRVGASNVSVPFANRGPGSSTIGASPSLSQPSSLGNTVAPGASGISQGARIVTRSGTFTPEQFLSQRDTKASIGGAARGATPKAQPRKGARIIRR